MQEQTVNQMESKGIVFKQPEEGLQFPVIMTAFDGEATDLGEASGARGRYVLFTLIDGQIQDQFYDPYEMSHAMAGDELRDFCLKVKRGWETRGSSGIPWDRLVDDQTYYEDSFPQFD